MGDNIIYDCINRYKRLKRHSNPILRQQIEQLEAWKLQQLQQCYAPLMASRGQRDLLNYYFNDLFSGIDLSEFNNADTAVKIIDKFFTGTDMLHSGLLFNAVTLEMNERIAEALFGTLNATSITVETYVEACHLAEAIPDLNQQLDVFTEFVDDLNGTAANKTVVAAVKIAKIPAKFGGFSNIYNLVAHGLKYLRDVDDPEAIALAVIQHERSIVKNIEDNAEVIFTAVPAN